MSEITIETMNVYISKNNDDTMNVTGTISVSSRTIAAEIVEEFERVLDKYDIYVPSGDEDDGNENRASLYGMTYFNLLDEVEAIVSQALHVVSEHCEHGKVQIIDGVLA